jgi:hypothetical protein
VERLERARYQVSSAVDRCPFVLISKGYPQRMRFIHLFVHELDLIRRAIWQRSISRRFAEIRSLHSENDCSHLSILLKNPGSRLLKKWTY